MNRSIIRTLNPVFFVLIATIGLAVQSSLFTSWPWIHLKPDIILLFVIWCGLKRGLIEGGTLTLVLAEIAEAHSAAPQGSFLISYGILFLGIRYIARYIVILHALSLSIITAIGSMTWKMTTALVLSLLGLKSQQLYHFFVFMFLGATIDGLLSFPVFRWFNKLDWITFKHRRAEHLIDEKMQLDPEGL